MGIDVFGRNPVTKEGQYFHNTVWWWRPLADYVCQIAPEITGACKYWQSKDGDGLVAQASIARHLTFVAAKATSKWARKGRHLS
jgi:hypothetical protein